MGNLCMCPIFSSTPPHPPLGFLSPRSFVPSTFPLLLLVCCMLQSSASADRSAPASFLSAAHVHNCARNGLCDVAVRQSVCLPTAHGNPSDRSSLVRACSDAHRYEFPGWVPPNELKFETLEPVDRNTLHHPTRYASQAHHGCPQRSTSLSPASRCTRTFHRELAAWLAMWQHLVSSHVY